MSTLRGIARGSASVAILACLPKCPACLAAYLAACTGIGLSFSTTSFLRTILIVLCITSLGRLAMQAIRRARPRHRPTP